MDGPSVRTVRRQLRRKGADTGSPPARRTLAAAGSNAYQAGAAHPGAGRLHMPEMCIPQGKVFGVCLRGWKLETKERRGPAGEVGWGGRQRAKGLGSAIGSRPELEFPYERFADMSR